MGNRVHSPQVARLWPLLTVGGCFLVGGILGCMFSALASQNSARQLGEYLTDYISLLKAGMITWSIPAVLWNQGRWFLFCVLFGLTGIGIIALPALFAARGFLFAFSVSCFIRFLGDVGAIPAALMFGLPALLWAPGFFLSGFWGLSSSFRIARSRTGESAASAWSGRSLRAYISWSIILFLLCVCLECALLPVLLPIAARIFG